MAMYAVTAAAAIAEQLGAACWRWNVGQQAQQTRLLVDTAGAGQRQGAGLDTGLHHSLDSCGGAASSLKLRQIGLCWQGPMLTLLQ